MGRVARPLQPTAAELRRTAIHTNYRAMLDMTAAGGYGTLYGPNVDAQGKVTELESEQSGCKDTIRQQRSKIASLRLEVGTWQQKAAKLKWQGPGSGEDHCHHTSHGSSVNDPAITYEFCISASSCRLFGDS